MTWASVLLASVEVIVAATSRCAWIGSSGPTSARSSACAWPDVFVRIEIARSPPELSPVAESKP